MNAKYKFNLFDLDGTLTDPSIGITNSIMYALKKCAVAVPRREELYKYIGPPLAHSFRVYAGLDDERAKEALLYYREYFGEKGIFENRLFDGIPELLQFITAGGGKVVLATGKPEEYAKPILEHFGILKYFDFVAGNTLDEKRSEKTQVIEHIITHYADFDARRAVMVGDREFDAAVAIKKHIEPIGVLFGFGSARELADAGVKKLARDVDELKKLLLY